MTHHRSGGATWAKSGKAAGYGRRKSGEGGVGTPREAVFWRPVVAGWALITGFDHRKRPLTEPGHAPAGGEAGSVSPYIPDHDIDSVNCS